MSKKDDGAPGFFLRVPPEQDAYLTKLVQDGKFIKKQDAVRHLISKAMEGILA